MARSNEPFWWAPFMAGAGIAALLIPVTIFLTTFGIMAGWIDEDRMGKLLASPFVRLYLFILVSLSLIHAAHRLRFILVDLGLKAARQVIAVLCYGAAVVGTLLALLLVLRVWP